MKNAEGSEQRVTVLSVGPVEEDHQALSAILADSRWPLCPGSEWTMETADSVPAALSILDKKSVPLVLCESDLGAASWRDVWEQCVNLPDPPSLIVASRLADEHLWAEALNLGAYDVLAKPFDPTEVVRTLSQAWLHRASRHARKRNRPAVGHPVALSGRPVAV
jgi:DNA-binding NtrC family response regulator